jgi:pyroglutamyl-peptidase
VQDDVTGMVEEPLVEGGPAAYFARLPVTTLAAHMSAAGAPTAVSHSAGAYICNEALYVAQHHLATSGRDLPSGFIHVPYLPEQAATKRTPVPSMALETQVLGVRAAVEFVRDLVAERAVAAGAR